MVKKILSILGIVLFVIAGFVGYKTLIEKRGTNEAPGASNITETPAPQESYPVTYTNEQAANLLLVVNKKHKLREDYAPATVDLYGGSLRQEAASAFTTLYKAASSNGFTPKFVSGYRSYERQEEVYNDYVAKDGQVQADTYSARPGYSEHQMGLAVDVDDGSGCSLQECFANTSFGKWLVGNASRFGFIIRYEKGKEAITGYQYEPWHLRYVGLDEAKKIVESGKTMDQYYGVEGGSYAN